MQFLLLLIIITISPLAHSSIQSQSDSSDISDIESISIDSNLVVNPNESDADSLKLLTDPENRVSAEFSVPKELLGSVGFWFNIYSKYSQFELVFFDETDHSKVYFVQDDRDLFQKGDSPIKIELTSELRYKKNIKKLRTAFANLIRSPKKSFSSDSLETKIVKLWGRKSSSQWNKIQSEIKTQRGQKDFIIEGISRSIPYQHSIEKVFVQSGLPSELTRIALLESSFQLEAQSKANAVGVWQFMESSGREFLTINKAKGIDERRSPIKASVAATKLLKRHIKILGSLYLGIISYNHGVRNLIKFKHKVTDGNIHNLLRADNKNSPLGFASRNYLAEFFAILYVDKYKDKLFNLKTSSLTSFDFTLIKTKKITNFFELAASHGCSIDDLKKFNPDIFSLNGLIPSGYSIVIPKKIRTAAI